MSSEFDGKRLVQRHQILYKLLDEEIKAGVRECCVPPYIDTAC